MQVLAIVQVRSSSERFPNKALAQINGKSILQHIIDRLEKIDYPGFDYIFAVSEKNHLSIVKELESASKRKDKGKAKNEIKEDVTKEQEQEQGQGNEGQGQGQEQRRGQGQGQGQNTQQRKIFHLGSEYNVLERFYSTLELRKNIQYVIRLTADNPFFDYSQIQKLIANFEKYSLNNFDYVYVEGLPLGMGFEWISTIALCKQSRFLLQKHHREHVTTFIKENPNLFRISSIPIEYFQLFLKQSSSPLHYKDLKIRLTLDEKTDLKMLQKTYHYFQNKKNYFFTGKDVLQLYFQNPEFYKDNLHIQQKSVSL